MRTFPRTARDYTGKRSAQRTTPRGGSVAEQLGASLLGRVSRQRTLVCHYDARDIEAADGATIDSWPDRANGHELTQATEGNRPTFSADGWGGGPAVSFGASAGMSSFFDGGIASESITCVALCTSSQAVTGTALEYTGNVYNNRGFSLLTDAGQRRTELGADSARSYVEGGDSIAGARFAVGMVGDRSTSTDTLILYGEDGAITPTSSGFVDGTGDHEAAYLYVGSRLANGTRPLDGLIRTIIAYEEPLSADEMQTVLDGLVATGSGLAAVVSSGGGGALVEYNMDDVAGTTVTTSGVVLFDSGGSDGGYVNNENYTVTFQAAVGQTVQATMTYCEIEHYYREGLTFSDNGTAMTNKIHGSGSAGTGFWESNSLPYVIETTSNVMQIQFESDGSVTDDGFRIEVVFND